MGQLLRYAAILALVAAAAWVTVPKGRGGNIPAELCCRAPDQVEMADNKRWGGDMSERAFLDNISRGQDLIDKLASELAERLTEHCAAGGLVRVWAGDEGEVKVTLIDPADVYLSD